mgnify:CR=1 FL=1
MSVLGIQKGIFFNPDGKKLASYLESLGPIFTKFWQLLSTRTDILDLETAKELESLTDSCKPFKVSTFKKIVESELGNSISNIFESFDDKPLAAASLAQVHSAKLKNGDEQAAKYYFSKAKANRYSKNVLAQAIYSKDIREDAITTLESFKY